MRILFSILFIIFIVQDNLASCTLGSRLTARSGHFLTHRLKAPLLGITRGTLLPAPAALLGRYHPALLSTTPPIIQEAVDIHSRPIYDTLFKVLFGTKDESEPRTSEFLDELFFEGRRVIESVEILPTEQRTIEACTIAFDVKCRADKVDPDQLELGTSFIIEMQNAYQSTFLRRLITYGAKEIARQWSVASDKNLALNATLPEGKRITTVTQYGQIKPVWIVAITSHILFKDDMTTFPRFWHIVDPLNPQVRATGMLRWCFLELPKFQDKVKNPENLQTGLERWTWLLGQDSGKIELTDQLTGSSSNLISAYERLQKLTSEEQAQLDRERTDALLVHDTHETLMAKSKAEGMDEGMTKGRAEGKAEGKAEGIYEGRKARDIEIARQMLKDNEDEQRIARYTELSIEEIRRLRSTDGV